MMVSIVAKRVMIASGLAVATILAGMLYFNSQDSWAKRKAEVAASFQEYFPGADRVAVDCVASAIVEAAEANECPLRDEDAMLLLEECASRNPMLEVEAGLKVMSCVQGLLK